jgi:hypothetical protein
VLGALAGMLLALALGEAVVRQVYWRPTVFDPELGVVPAPGSTQRFAIEGVGTSRWTVRGIRRAEPPDPERPSILAVGDSFTEALMIDDADVFTHRLERQLAARGLAMPVLNVGASGFSAADYVALAGAYAARFDVRWTVIQILPNDLADDAWNPIKTHFVRAPDGTLELDRKRPVARRRLFDDALKRSALAVYANYRLRVFAEGAAKEPPPFRAPVRRPPKPTPDYPVEEVFDRVVAAYGGRLTFLVLSDIGPPGPVESRITARCRATGTSCVALRDVLPAFEARHESPYGFANSTWGKGHLNAAGHHAAADLLTDELLRLHALDLL